jgi:hypothetical protein
MLKSGMEGGMEVSYARLEAVMPGGLDSSGGVPQ